MLWAVLDYSLKNRAVKFILLLLYLQPLAVGYKLQQAVPLPVACY
jgi:hypothetical protein